MKRTFFVILYYGFARYLPASFTRPFGKLSKRIRYLICKNIFKKCGQNVNVEKGAWFGRGAGIEIGDNSGIGINCRVHNNTVIGKDVMMGPNVYMLESTHLFNRTDIPMRQQGKKKLRDKVFIEDDCWIGREVMIIGSRTIKTGTVLGARTLLAKDFPAYSIIGGNPAKIIRSRV
ncbi:MAG: acyltransferase [Bacteroidales bacterium]|nr:acyltransferase [Bacteroidales bacterium]